MFIDSFRGLGTSLVEGCAGDFRPNAAECDRVHPSVRQRASGRAMADRSPHDRDRSTLNDKFGDRSAKFGDRSPGHAGDSRN